MLHTPYTRIRQIGLILSSVACVAIGCFAFTALFILFS